MENPKFNSEVSNPASVSKVSHKWDGDRGFHYSTQALNQDAYSGEWNGMVLTSRFAQVKGIFIPETGMLGWTTDQVIHDGLALSVGGQEARNNPILITITRGNIMVATRRPDPESVLAVADYLDRSITEKRDTVNIRISATGSGTLYRGPLDSFAPWRDIQASEEV